MPVWLVKFLIDSLGWIAGEKAIGAIGRTLAKGTLSGLEHGGAEELAARAAAGLSGNRVAGAVDKVLKPIAGALPKSVAEYATTGGLAKEGIGMGAGVLGMIGGGAGMYAAGRMFERPEPQTDPAMAQALNVYMNPEQQSPTRRLV